MSQFKVTVIGAGLGGLCLAQALRKASVDVQIFERDRSFWDRPQGYRLHLDADGIGAVAEALTPDRHAVFDATSMRPLDFTTIVDTAFCTVRRVGSDVHGSSGKEHAAEHRNVDRGTLRQTLFAGLEDVVHFGEKFVGYDSDEQGVTARFQSGRQVRSNVLVGADGIRSVVRAQRAPQARVMDTGVRAIYGRVPMEAAKRILPPTALTDVFTVAVDERKVFLGLGPVAFPERPDLVAPWLRRQDDYVVCIVGGRREHFGHEDPALHAMDSATLQQLAATMLGSWPAATRDVPAHGDPTSFFIVDMFTSVPTVLDPSANITLLGDAIHSMTPTLGRGANVAMRDGVHLAGGLVEVAEGRVPLRVRARALRGTDDELRLRRRAQSGADGHAPHGSGAAARVKSLRRVTIGKARRRAAYSAREGSTKSTSRLKAD